MTRCLTVWLLLTGLTAAATALVAPEAALLLPGTSGRGPGDFEDLLVRVAAGVGQVGLARVWLVGTLAVRDAVRAVRSPAARVARGRPDGAVRRWVLVACGVAALGSLAVGPAQASPGGPGGPDGPEALRGLPYPDRATGSAAPAARPRAEVVRGRSGTEPTLSRSGPEQVVVRPGDSLWSIAERSLPPGASAAEIDARWRAVWALNRGVVGADPHLIRPDQRLVWPRDHDREDRP